MAKRKQEDLLEGLRPRTGESQAPTLAAEKSGTPGTASLPASETLAPRGLAVGHQEALPGIVEYNPVASLEKWRVEKFELFQAEFAVPAPFEKGMAMFHQAASEYSRGWLIARRLFGIAPLILPADADPEEWSAQSREAVCGALGLERAALQAELDALRGLVGSHLREEDSQSQIANSQETPARMPAVPALQFGDEVLREFGFNERMFNVTTWDPVQKQEVPRAQEENRAERDWFCKRVKEWERMLREPRAGTVAREALLNDLYLKRLGVEMGSLSPSMGRFKELRAMKAEIEESYQEQLGQLGEMFPEMNIEGKVSFQAVLSDVILAVRDYKAGKGTKLLDRVRTSGEIEVEMRQSVQSPLPRYRFSLNLAIVEAVHGLYDPDWRSQFRHSTLKKIDAAVHAAIEAARVAQNEPLVDLEKGVEPGTGEEWPDLREDL